MINRFYTKEYNDPFFDVEWVNRDSSIKNSEGYVVFEQKKVEVPSYFSQLATDILASKYFRKTGLYSVDKRGETSFKDVILRIVRTIKCRGVQEGYFLNKEEADVFADELSYMLVHQIGAFNSPVWFNCGLWHEYSIKGNGEAWVWSNQDYEPKRFENVYERPQCSACFIQSVKDDLGSIYDLLKTESMLFKFGSGTGSNFSNIRGKQEKLSGGGMSSGLMSFLEVFDKAAGVIKSGGVTRRAAKMVCLDMDHPEILDFIQWKAKEEKKVKALINAGYSDDFNGEAYRTVSGQNSNNSVRITDDFMHAVQNGEDWFTIFRASGDKGPTYKADKLWSEIAECAWECADPGIQYHSTINRWHTVPITGPIRASNPCVTGDTLVATSKGLQRIDSMLDSQSQIVGSDGELYTIKPAFKTGVKPVYKLSTKSGLELKLTADHRVLTKNRGDVAACELTKDDVLVLGKPQFGTQTMDLRLAQFLGLMLGDGCISGAQQTATLTFGSRNNDLAQRVHKDLNSYRVEKVSDGRALQDTEVRRIKAKEIEPETSLNTNEERHVLSINTSVRCVVEPLMRYAILYQGSQQKALKNEAFLLNKESVAAILRGLFTANGTVANYGDKYQYISLESVSSTLLSQVQQILLGFGIKSKIYRNRRVAGQTMTFLPDGKGGRKEYPIQQLHSLRISRSSLLIFEKEIGFMPESAKSHALATLNQQVSVYEDRWEDKVESLTLIGEHPVYDLTEPVTHHFVANGLVVHNCSEYMFLDDTACNLASLNLTQFLREDGSFNLEGYRHAIRVFFIAQEILVDFSSYPTRDIARNSHNYRPLGLGYANLGTLLMIQGIPYDSDAGRAWCGALTSILTGHAYRVSAEMAARKGPFAGYTANREPFLRVMGMHQEAAREINSKACPPELFKAAQEEWVLAIDLGKKVGFRNAQATVLAPTGTIGLLMDCDTTGIEPDFSIVKFKKLAGGGYFKIVNQSVPQALRKLGYSEPQVQDILAYVLGTNTLLGAPHINRASLKAKGLTNEDLDKIEAALPSSLDLRGAFSPWVLGKETMVRFGFVDTKPGFDLLSNLGFSAEQIEEAGDHISGNMTIEGAPHLRGEHLPVFDCANRCGKKGQRFLAPMSHLRMMAAAQQFLSGAISKTVNLPNDATVKDIEDIYYQGWKLGLKAVAVYRDGCKNSQPLSTSGVRKEVQKNNVENQEELPKCRESNVSGEIDEFTSNAFNHGQRRRLPEKRTGFTQEARVGGHKIFLRTGDYAEGKLGEIFIDMHKEGAAFRSMMNCFAMSVSIGLQHGVPLETYVEQFTFTRFEPQGTVEGHPNIKLATSIVDYIFRVLGVEYLRRYDLCQVKSENSKLEESKKHYVPPVIKKHIGIQVVDNGELQTKNSLNDQLDTMMGDAPMCDVCGHTTVRNGTCYRCLNCGNSMGCS
jgi:ribonucleoside-diphosphate reductase alpha chain